MACKKPSSLRFAMPNSGFYPCVAWTVAGYIATLWCRYSVPVGIGSTPSPTCLAQATEVFGIPWRAIEHVSAHAGHQWNEFADLRAKAAVAVMLQGSSLVASGAAVKGDRPVACLFGIPSEPPTELADLCMDLHSLCQRQCADS